MTVDKHTLDKAKKWADRVKSFDHGQMEGNAPAAAEVILSLPDVIVDGDKLREWIEGMKVSDQPGGAQALLDYLKRDFLPTPEPQVEIKLGAWAMHPEYGKVLICSTEPDEEGDVRGVCEVSDRHDGSDWVWAAATDLSPLPDAQGDSDSDQGSNRQGTLNSSPEPQPGEAWEFAYWGERFVGLVTNENNLLSIRCGGSGPRNIKVEDAEALRRLVPAQEPRVLTTVEDYENAADGTVANWGPTVIEKKNGAWYSTGSNAWNETDSTMSDHGPCTVLWEPEA